MQGWGSNELAYGKLGSDTMIGNGLDRKEYIVYFSHVSGYIYNVG